MEVQNGLFFSFFLSFEVRNSDLKILLKVFYLKVIRNQFWNSGCQGLVGYFRPSCLFKALSFLLP